MVKICLQCGRPGSIPELGRSLGEGNGNSLVYSCLEKSTDRGAWWATVHGVTKSQTRLRDEHTHTGMINWIIGHWWLNFHLLPLIELSSPAPLLFLSFLKVWGWGWKFQACSHVVVFLVTRPYLEGIWPAPHTLGATSLAYRGTRITQETAKCSGNSEPDRKKIKYYVFIKPQVFFLVG